MSPLIISISAVRRVRRHLRPAAATLAAGLLGLVLLALAAPQAHADKVHNILETATSTDMQVGVGFTGISRQDRRYATSFTTGTNGNPAGNGWTLNHVFAKFAAKVGSPSGFRASIFTDSNGSPGTERVQLSGSAPDTAGDKLFSCSGANCALTDNTTYWLVFAAPDGDLNSDNYYAWRNTASDNETRVPWNNGWSIGNSHKYDLEETGAWTAGGQSVSGLMEVDFSAVAPTLSHSNYGQTTVTLTIGTYSGTWYYKYSSPAGGTCSSAVTGTTANVTGLTAGGTYTFKAYNDSACATQIAVTTAFDLIPPDPANLRVTAGVESLTLNWNASTGATSYEARWRLSGSTGSYTTRQSISGTSTTISSLTGGTTYEVGVRAVGVGPSSWTGATGTPASPVTLTASNVRKTTATLTIANYTGTNWYYKYTTPTGGTCSAAQTGTTASLTTLTANTAYTFKAYSDSGCATEVTSDTTDAEFTTASGVSLRANNITNTSFRLTAYDISSYPSLRFKRVSPTAGVCRFRTTNSAAVAGWDIGSLSPATTYTYELYAPQACQSNTKIADVTFTTLATLAASAVKETTATLTITGRTTAWWYQGNQAGAQCKSVAANTSTASLTGLTGGTSYTYKAYGAAGCNAANLISTAATFSTVGLSAESLAQAGATLTIANWTNAWWYKGSQTGAQCTSVAANTTTASLALAAGTSYTYTAYSASGCATANEIADVAFSTPAAVALAASAVKETTATLTLASWTSAWWYKGNQTGAQCTSVAANTTTASLTGLTGGTSYTYKAYSKTGCNAADLISTDAAFSTVGLSAGSLTQRTATLTLANWATAWWHKQTSPAAGTCVSVAASTTTASLTGLTAATGYTWTVYGAAGCNATNKIADAAFTTTAATAPPAPTGLTVAAGNQQVTLSWTSGGDGGAAISKWQYVKKAGAGNFETTWTDMTGSGASTTSHTVTGLTNGTAYKFKLRAVNSVGNGAESAESSAVTPALLGVCNRTAEIRAAILNEFIGKTCGQVTATDLDDITSLIIQNKSTLTSLRAGDFDGLTALTSLLMGSNGLTSLPARIFDDLTALELLHLNVNSLASLPAGVFDKLTALTSLRLDNNSLTTLPAGAFDKLTALTSLRLQNNSLTTLPAGIFDKTTALTSIYLNDNSLTSLRAGVFDKLTSLSSLRLNNNSSLACLPFIPSSVSSPLLDARTYSACGAGVTVGSSGVTVGQSVGSTYTVVLDAYPRGNVTVTPASGATGTATVSGALTFTQSNWSTAQSVTVTGVAAGSTTVSHTVAGGGYGSATAADVAVTVTAGSLAASAITKTTATLILSGHVGNWYYQYTAPTGGTCSSVQTGTTASLTNLTTGTTYTFTAYSDSTCSTVIAVAPAFTPATKPSAPATPAATWGNGTVTLTWTAPNNGGSPITDYDYQTRNQTDGGAWTEYDATDTSTATTKTLTLTNGKLWRLRIRAGNAKGDSTWSWPFAEVVVGSPAPVAAPTLTALSGGQVRVAWTAPATNGSALTGYSLWHKQGAGAWTEVTGIAGSATSHTLTLTAGQTYTIGVEAHNARGGSNPSASEFDGATTSTTMAVALTASAVKETTATLTLANHTAAWWYQGDQEGAQCTAVTANTTTASLTGLTGGTTYTYKAYSATGCNATNLLATATAFSTVGLTAGSVTSTGATLTLANWSAAWWHQKTSPATPAGTCVSVAANTTTASLTGLTAGTSYTWTVYGATGCNASDKVADVDFTTPATAPPATAKPTVTAGNASVALTWTSGGNGGSAITKWQYVKKVGDTAFETTWTDIPSSGATTTSYTVTGLTNGTAYKFKVRAVNSVGDGAASPESDSVTPATTPPAPVKPSATAGHASVALTWSSNGNGGSAITKWQYVKKVGNTAFEMTWTDIPSSSASTTSYTVTGLTNGTAYRFKVRAVNSVGDGAASPESDSVTPAATVPPAPAKPTVTAGNASVALTWTSGGDGGSAITKWEYAYKTTGAYGSWTAIPNSGASTTSYTVTGLTNDTAYKFKLRAVNSVGNGTESAESSAVTPLLGVCDHTAQIRDAIVAAVSGKTTCSAITDTDLAGITTLAVEDDSTLTTLQAGDFAGLTALTTLDLDDNGLTALPANVFDNLTALTWLDVRGNSLTSLPAGVFDNLTKLTTLELSQNSLSSLRSGVFDKLTALTYLGLYTNSLTVLPANVFDKLTKLTGLDLGRNNLSSSTLPDGVFDELTKLDKLWIGGNSGLATLPAGIFDNLASLTTLFALGQPQLTCLPFFPNNSQVVWSVAEPGSAACGAAVTLGATDVTVGPGQTATYTVVLDAYPRGNVTVTPASGATGTATVSGALTFTTGNWSTAQSVTVTGVAAGSTTLTHTVAGGGYGGATAPDVAATVTAASLAASAVTQTTATLTLTGHTGNWHYKYTAPAGGTCSSAQTGTTASLTTLTGGTAYTFAAYSDSTCATLVAAAPAFTTLDLTASAITQTTATLTLSGHTGNWYHKKTSPTPAGSCSAAQTGTTASLTNLTTSTSYTWKAYSDSACATEIASESFTTAAATAPPAPTRLTATAGNASVTLSWTSGGNGGAAITKWQYVKKAGSSNFETTWTDVTGSGAGTTSHTVTGLDNGTAYRFKVRAVNSVGNGAESPVSDAVTPAPAGQPGKPEMIPFISGTGNFGAYFLVKWTHPANGPSNYYEIRTSDESLAQTGYSGSTTEGKFIRGPSTLRRGNNWTLKVRGHTVSGGGTFGPWSYTTTARAALPTATASNIGTTGATLTVSNLPARWWYKGEQAGATCTAVPNGTSAVTLTGLSPGVSYTYNVYYRDTCTEDSDKAAHWDVKATFTTESATLAASAVTETEATLTITGHTAAWWYQGNQTGAQCTSVAANTTTASLSGLTGGTTYTYKAYSAAGCTAANLLATAAAFSTVGLTAGSVTSSGATLTLANWTSAWWYKGNQSGAQCTSVNANTTTADLSSLDAVTDYTYSVYSAAGCASSNKIADVEFTTPSGATLDVSAIKETTATLTIGTWAGNWYHKQVDPAGGTCSSVQTGTTASLTGLTGGTQYAWQVYSDSACTTAIATTFFSTVGLTANPTSTGATLTLAYWPSAWWHNKTSGPGTASCTSVAANTRTATLSGLTSGSNYTWAVYSAANCNAADKIADVDFTTPTVSLAASDVKETTATLTITNHTGNWYYKKTSPTPAGSCSTAQTGTTADLSELTGDTAYTYKAYSNSGCATELTSDSTDAEFSTVGLTATDLAQTTATLNLSNWTAAWWHKKTAPDTPAGTCASVAANTSTADLADLTPNSDYTWTVYSAAGCGDTDKIADVDFSAPALSLAAPTLSVQDAGTARQISLGWSHPSEVSGIQAYRVRYREKGQDTWTYADAKSDSGEQNFAGGATSATIPANESFTMKDNTIYEVQLRAGKWNGGYSGWGTWTATAEATTLPGQPDKPTATSGAGSGRLTLSSSVTGNGTITKWQYVKKVGAGNFETTWTDIAVESTALSHVVTNLTNGTSYQFKVRAVNATGTGADSDASEAAQPADETLTASSVEDDTATLTIANHTGDWHYKADAAPHTSCSSAVTGTAASLTSLSTNTSYTYKAYSNSGCGTELATAAAFLTKPGQPTKPTATAGAGSGKLTLSAAAVTGSGAITKWQYSTDSGTSWADVPGTNTSTTVSGTVTGLTDGTSYTVQVRAVNATGHGDASDASDGATPTDETLAASSVEDDTATLTLTGHTGNWHYKYTSPTGGTCSSAQSGTTASLTSLSTNTSYTYKAYSDSGCTDTNELAAAAAFLTKPGKPTKPTATAGAGSGKLTLSAAAVTGGGAITKWQYSTDSGTSWTDVPGTNTSTTVSGTVTGLTDGTSYTIQVRAVNATGHGDASAASDGATPTDETLAASSVEDDTATLTLTGHTGNWHYKYTSPTGGTCSSAQSGTTASLTSLSTNTSYTYKAYSDSGCTDTNELAAAAAFLTKPGKPTKPTATAGAGSGKLTLSVATVTGSGDITKWQYSTDSGTNWTDVPGDNTSTTVSGTVTGLTDGTSYTIQVRAVNATGHGAASAASDAATPADETLTASSVEATTATLTITGYTGDWYYKYTVPSGGTCSTVVSNGTTTASLTSLSTNTSYTYKAYSNSGCGTELATAAAFLTKPGQPTKPTATAGAGSGKLTLSVATVTGDGAITKWQYVKKVGTGNFETTWSDVPGDNTLTTVSGTVTGLTDGTSYQFKVRAVNATGTGAESDASTATQPTDETLTASSVTTTGATLTIGNYSGSWYYKQTAPTTGDCSTEITVTSTTVSGLTANTSYTFKAYSNTNCNDTHKLAEADFTTQQAVGTPPAPSKPRVTGGNARVALTWTSGGNGGSAITQWQYVKAVGSNSFETTWRDVPGSGASTTGYTVTSLTNGTAYRFKVRAVNSVGTGAASPASDEVTPSSDSQTEWGEEVLTANAVTQTTGTMTITGHTGDWWYTVAGGSCKQETGTTVTLTGLTPGTRYTVTAYSDSACTTEIVRKSFTTLHDPPRFGALQATRTLLYLQNTAIVPLTLPAATGGNPPLRYALAPEPPTGLTFDSGPQTRVLTGTPMVAQAATRYTYTVTDSAGLQARVTVILTVTADLQPTFGDEEIKAQTYEQDRAIVALTLPAATSGNPPLRYALAPEPPEGLRFDNLTRVLTGTPTAAQAATEYTYTATDVDGDPAALRFTITVRATGEKEILTDGLAAQGRALLSSATGVIGARFRNPGASSFAGTGVGACLGEAPGEAGPEPVETEAPEASGGAGPDPDCTAGVVETVVQAVLSLSGGVGGAGAVDSLDLADADETRPRGPRVGDLGSQPAWNWETLLWGQSFALPLKTPAAPSSTWTLWGAGDVQGFQGTPRQGQYDGQVRSLYLGVDTRWPEQWLAGAALARSWGTLDYVARAGAGQGRLETTLTSVYPYVRGTLGAGLDVWAIGGYGLGEAEHTRPDVAGVVESSDLRMAMGATGARQPMTEWGGVEVAVVGGAGYLSLATEAGETVIADLDVAVQRVRLAVEATWAAEGLAPYVQVGGRYDGGAGQTGAGLETVAGLRYTSERVEFEARGRWLAAHAAAGYEEYGGLARLAVKPRADGTGFQLNVAPSWGAAQGAGLLGGGETLLDGGAVPGAGLGGVPAAGPDRVLVLESDLGYGFAVFEGQGVLTPYGGFALTGEETRRYRLGTRLGVAEWLNLSLEGSRSEATGQQAATQGVQLTLEGRF